MRSLWTNVTLTTGGTGTTSGADIALRTSRANRSTVTLGSGRSGVALGTHRPCGAGVTLRSWLSTGVACTGWPRRTGRANVTLRACGTGGASGTRYAVTSVRPLRSQRSWVTLWPWRTARTGGTIDTLRPWRTERPWGALRTRRTGRTSRTGDTRASRTGASGLGRRRNARPLCWRGRGGEAVVDRPLEQRRQLCLLGACQGAAATRTNAGYGATQDTLYVPRLQAHLGGDHVRRHVGCRERPDLRYLQVCQRHDITFLCRR